VVNNRGLRWWNAVAVLPRIFLCPRVTIRLKPFMHANNVALTYNSSLFIKRNICRTVESHNGMVAFEMFIESKHVSQVCIQNLAREFLRIIDLMKASRIAGRAVE
jgi:hypothetical protein